MLITAFFSLFLSLIITTALAQTSSGTGAIITSTSSDLTTTSSPNAAATSATESSSLSIVSSSATTSSSSFSTSTRSSLSTSISSTTTSDRSLSHDTPSTTLLSMASGAPSATPVAASAPSKKPVSDETLAIILGAAIGAIALLSMLLVFWCAFRHNRLEWQPPTEKQSARGSIVSSNIMQTVIAKKRFSSLSANAPEVLHRSESTSSRGHRKLPPALQIHHPSDSEIGLALDKVDESPDLTPMSNSQPSLHQSLHRASGDARPSRASLSKYNTRSVDLMDAASRYSIDRSPAPRSSVSPVLYRNSSADFRSHPPTQFSPYATLQNNNSNPFFKSSQDSLRSRELSTPSPALMRGSARRESPGLYHTSWSELPDLDFDESDGQRGSRERPSAAMSRRSGSWKPDRVAGRYELA